MSIQILSYNKSLPNIHNEAIINSSLSNPSSPDMFELNVLYLQSKELWDDFNASDSYRARIKRDLDMISEMLLNTVKTNILIVFPINYIYFELYSKTYELIHHIDVIYTRLNTLTKELDYRLIYENTVTRIASNQYKASFYLNGSCGYTLITESDKSKKPVTIQRDRFILTTLNFQQDEQLLFDYLMHIGLMETKESLPEWLRNYPILDDKQQQLTVEKNETIIQQAEQEITNAQEILEQNNYYKSILHINGNELVYVVNDILEEILSCNLADFTDKKNEDFLIKCNDITFIGEIKGISSNVRRQDVMQVELHRQKYIDVLKEENKIEPTKTLLIINHQKQKPLNEREPVHKTQIELAQSYKCLIIETVTLLKLLEKFRKKEITTEACIELFESETGLLKI